MAVNTKIIKRRIKSITSTKKITKAMEMISAVKMRKAVKNVLSTRSYAKLSWEMLQEIAKKTDINAHPLLAAREVKKIGLIFITSNRGFAGGFTSRMLTEAHKYILETEKGNPKVEVILTGKRGRKIYQKFGHTVAAEFDKIDLTNKAEEILPLARLAVQEYVEGKYDKIVVAYTDFVSALQQIPRIKQILPLVEPNKTLGTILNTEDDEIEEVSASEYGYLFEPDPTAVLDVLIPRLVEMQIYQAVLESDASEHSARMLAMRNASDAATDMIKELNYTFNKARQASITREITEIVGGAAALDK